MATAKVQISCASAQSDRHLFNCSWEILLVKPPGGSGTLIFSYLRRLGSILWFKILNFNIFGGFQKSEYFGGMQILWIFFGVITKLDSIKGSFLCILGSSLKVKIQNGGFLGCW